VGFLLILKNGLTKHQIVSHKKQKKEAYMKYILPIFSVLMVWQAGSSYANTKEAMIPTNQVVNLKTTPIYNQKDIKTVTDFVKSLFCFLR
jgi:ABC-type nitrate/sulfonate/bicarbonate transport system permease component